MGVICAQGLVLPFGVTHQVHPVVRVRLVNGDSADVAAMLGSWHTSDAAVRGRGVGLGAVLLCEGESGPAPYPGPDPMWPAAPEHQIVLPFPSSIASGEGVVYPPWVWVWVWAWAWVWVWVSVGGCGLG